MSNLTAVEWSGERVKVLQKFEDVCNDDDLFCVGYLIPMVQLLEVEYEQELGTKQEWNEEYFNFVDNCLEKDKVTGKDRSRILEILEETSA